VKKTSRASGEKTVNRSPKDGCSIYVHHGASRVAARIRFRENGSLTAGKEKVAHLRLSSPIFAFIGDRFVLRDSSEQNTIAGGTVLDPDADPATFRSVAHIGLLRERVTAPRDVDICVRYQLKRDAFAECKTLLVKSNFGADEIRKALSRLGQHGEVVLADDIVTDASYWHDLINSAARIIDRAHQQNPERRGVDVSELLTELEIKSDKLFSAVISELIRNGFARSENQIGRVSHRPSLPPELVSAAENIRATLSAKRFDPPDRKAFSQDRRVQQALRFLIDQGEIVEISSEIVVLRETDKEMQNAVTELLSKHGSAAASQVRQKIGTTRRVIIPFLEYLDRIGVTRRIGNERVLAKKSAAAKLANAASAQQT
jgi:selenocysteine-specific elongation factor